MNRKYVASLCFLLLPICLTSGCSKSIKPYSILSVPTRSCSKAPEMLESSFVCVNSLENVLPFDSGIKITVYQNDSDKRKNEFSDYFVNRIANISAIFDRHNSYKNRVDLNTRFEDLYNLKSYNDDIKNFIISNETEKYIDLSNSEILYKGLKEAYEFSLNSIVEKDGIKMTKYNMTIGALSDLDRKSVV